MKTKKALPILFTVMFLVMVGFGIIIPVLPFYAEDLGASPTELGLLMAAYSFMQLLFAPLWGRVSDRIGRKPVMMIGIVGLAFHIPLRHGQQSYGCCLSQESQAEFYHRQTCRP